MVLCIVRERNDALHCLEKNGALHFKGGEWCLAFSGKENGALHSQGGE